MTRFSFYLLLMYVHVGRWLSAHTRPILILATLSVAVIVWFYWRGWRARRHTTQPEQQFPTNLLAVYPTGTSSGEEPVLVDPGGGTP